MTDRWCSFPLDKDLGNNKLESEPQATLEYVTWSRFTIVWFRYTVENGHLKTTHGNLFIAGGSLPNTDEVISLENEKLISKFYQSLEL